MRWWMGFAGIIPNTIPNCDKTTFTEKDLLQLCLQSPVWTECDVPHNVLFHGWLSTSESVEEYLCCFPLSAAFPQVYPVFSVSNSYFHKLVSEVDPKVQCPGHLDPLNKLWRTICGVKVFEVKRPLGGRDSG